MCKKCTSNFYINTKNVQTVQNLYKVQTKNGLKLEMCFCIQTMYKLYKTYTTSSLKLHLYVFCTYTQCTNYKKCIPMLIESYMQLLMYVFCICNNPIFFTFQIFASTMMPSSILFYNFVKFQDQYFHTQKDSFSINLFQF